MNPTKTFTIVLLSTIVSALHSLDRQQLNPSQLPYGSSQSLKQYNMPTPDQFRQQPSTFSYRSNPYLQSQATSKQSKPKINPYLNQPQYNNPNQNYPSMTDQRGTIPVNQKVSQDYKSKSLSDKNQQQKISAKNQIQQTDSTKRKAIQDRNKKQSSQPAATQQQYGYQPVIQSWVQHNSDQDSSGRIYLGDKPQNNKPQQVKTKKSKKNQSSSSHPLKSSQSKPSQYQKEDSQAQLVTPPPVPIKPATPSSLFSLSDLKKFAPVSIPQKSITQPEPIKSTSESGQQHTK